MRTPETARPRDDLPWLRRRTVRPAVPEAPPALPSSTRSGRRVRWRPRRPQADTSLDLSPSVPVVPAAPAGPRHRWPRGCPGGTGLDAAAGIPPTAHEPGRPTLLTPAADRDAHADPVRRGGLTITAATSVGDGDLRLGCAYGLRSGASSLVQAVSQVTVAPRPPDVR